MVTKGHVPESHRHFGYRSPERAAGRHLPAAWAVVEVEDGEEDDEDE